MKTKVATLMAVYRGDDPLALAVALESVLGQQFADEVESRLYLAVDGPVPADINRVIAERGERIYRVQRLIVTLIWPLPRHFLPKGFADNADAWF